VDFGWNRIELLHLILVLIKSIVVSVLIIEGHRMIVRAIDNLCVGVRYRTVCVRAFSRLLVLPVPSLTLVLSSSGRVSRTFRFLRVVLALGKLGFRSRRCCHSRMRLVRHLTALAIDNLSSLLLLHIV